MHVIYTYTVRRWGSTPNSLWKRGGTNRILLLTKRYVFPIIKTTPANPVGTLCHCAELALSKKRKKGYDNVKVQCALFSLKRPR